MYFPIYWDEVTGICSLSRKSDADVEIFPLRGDGSEGCWRWGYEKVEQHLDWMHAKRSGVVAGWMLIIGCILIRRLQ